MSYPLWLRRRWMSLSRKNYFHFEDPEVERVIANNIGDGVGTTLAQIRACTSIGTWFRGNTAIIIFDEFEYFTSVTSLQGGSSTSNTGAFGGCSNLRSIKLPNSLTSIGGYSFYNDTALSDINIPSSVTSIGSNTFTNCNSIKDLHLPNVNVMNTNIGQAGSGTGTLVVKSFIRSGDIVSLGFKKVIVLNSINVIHTSGYVITTYVKSTNKTIQVARFLGNVNTKLDLVRGSSGSSAEGSLMFIELMGTGTDSGSVSFDNMINSGGCIVHLGYDAVTNNAVPCTPAFVKANSTRVTKVYVGDGSSAQNDNFVLQKYTENTNWASYSSKLATWWDYNGGYRTYCVSSNLTNCSNSNTIEWPFITRNEAYETILTANDGYSLSSVQVLMYEAQDNGTTPNNPTDITSSVYDSLTGSVYIEHVKGNITINATAV